MAANAGSVTFLGLKSNRTYTIDMYVPDAVSTFLGLNSSGLAGTSSPTSWRATEDVVLRDMSIAAAPTAVGAIMQKNNANENGAAIRWANQLASNPNRPKLNVMVKEGDFISFLQF